MIKTEERLRNTSMVNTKFNDTVCCNPNTEFAIIGNILNEPAQSMGPLWEQS